MNTGVVYDRRYLDHRMGAYHPESPDRIEVLNRMLEEEAPCPFQPIKPRAATTEEIGWVHERGYIDLIRSTAGKDHVYLDPDTSAGPLTFDTALLAAGGLLEALDHVMEGRIQNAFALVRPPGHHAEASEAKGFCIFNNVAVGAEFLIRIHGLQRVLIVDWDIHHGNGTQHAFYSRNNVLYFSTHRSPFYPGTGALHALGEGEGYGFNLNVPLRAGKSDGDFLAIYRQILRPVLNRFEPEFILVSAGFDLGQGDPLGGMLVTKTGFGLLAASLIESAGKVSDGRIAFVLEGGYNLKTLREGVGEVLVRLSNPDPVPLPEPAMSDALRAELEPCFRTFGPIWDVF